MNKEIRGLKKSITYALRGIGYCIMGERNMRIHLTAAAFVLWLAQYYSLSRGEFFLLLFAIALTIACEMLNTAMEALVNIHSPAYHALARVAKDIAAGAVLVCAGFSAALGLCFFWQPAVLVGIWQTFMQTPLYLGAFVACSALGILFIFMGPRKLWAWVRRPK